jgi:hypothetical protein
MKNKFITVSFIVYVYVCCVLIECGVYFCVVCLIVQMPLDKYPFAVN